MGIPDLQHRDFDAAHPEEMDRPDLPEEVLRRDLANLRTINRHFGGREAAHFAVSLARTLPPSPSLLDCACGGGDLTACQHRHLRPGRSCAIDLHPVTLRLAREYADIPELEFTHGDLLRLPFDDGAFDVVTCHLALHHFSNADAIRVLRELGRVAGRLVVVTDLERSRWGYLGVWLLVHLWLRDDVTRHDALLSVRRAWNRVEFSALAREAGWKEPKHRRLPWFRQALWWSK